MEKVTIAMGSVFPVPATKGGAVENLVENMIKVQQHEKKIDLNIICAFDFEAVKKSHIYTNTKFHFIKINCLAKILDKLIALIANKVFKKKNVMAYSFICQRLLYYRKISQKLKQEECGKIILENSMGLYLSLKWNKNYLKYRGKYYYHCHNKVNKTFGCDDIIKNTNKFISVSNYMSKDLRDFLKNIELNKFATLKNVVDVQKFEKIVEDDEKRKIKEQLNIKDKDKIIIFVGRLTEEKGIRELLKAISNLKDLNFKILIVGSYFFNTTVKSEFENELEQLIKDNEQNIIFTGYINYDELYKYYNIADIAVLPSMWEEPAGLTIQEAEVCGLPIITTDSGGIPEYVNEKCAILIKRDKDLIKNLSKAISDILNDSQKINLMKEESIKISKKIKLDHYYYDLLNILSKT